MWTISSRGRWWFWAVVVSMTWLIVAATFLGFGGRLWWALGLLSPFRMQYLLISFALMLILLLGVKRKSKAILWAFFAAILSFAANLFQVAPLYFSPPDVQAEGPALKVMAFNVYLGNRLLEDVKSAAPVARMIDDSGASIVVVQEVTVHRLTMLGRALPGYRLIKGFGRPDSFGIAMFIRRADEAGDEAQRISIESVQMIDVTGGITTVPQVELLCRWGDRPLSVLGMHTISDLRGRSKRQRDAMLDGAQRWATRHKAQGRAVIIMGDLNASPWCAPLIDLIDHADLIDSAQGFGVQGSFPAFLPKVLNIPIDQCLHSDELVTRQRQVGPHAVHSDHQPLVVELQWRK